MDGPDRCAPVANQTPLSKTECFQSGPQNPSYFFAIAGTILNVHAQAPKPRQYADLQVKAFSFKNFDNFAIVPFSFSIFSWFTRTVVFLRFSHLL